MSGVTALGTEIVATVVLVDEASNPFAVSAEKIVAAGVIVDDGVVVESSTMTVC